MVTAEIRVSEVPAEATRAQGARAAPHWAGEGEESRGCLCSLIPETLTVLPYSWLLIRDSSFQRLD